MDKKTVLQQVIELLKAIKSEGLEKARIDEGKSVESKKNDRKVRSDARAAQSKIKPNLPKAEANPDKEADAKVGEKVEEIVEEHMLENKDAEQKEGHKIVEKGESMDSKKLLETAKELLKSAQEGKLQEELTKATAAPAPAPAPQAPVKMPSMKIAPKAPAMKAPPMAPQHPNKKQPAPPMMKEQKDASAPEAPKVAKKDLDASKPASIKMSKEEIKADLKKEWKPKFKKESC